MAAGTGLIIEAVDYTTIRNKIIGIMGTGAGQSGYGQILLSSGVAIGNTVTKAQWDNLRFDLLNARIHQDGLVPTIVTATQGQPIRYGAGHPNNQYNTQADTAITNKFNIGTGQFVIDAATSTTRSTPWNASVSATVTVTFGTADQARYFFNSGSKIRCVSSRTGGTGSPQNSSWSSILDNAGAVEFGGNTSGLNFYNLTNSYQNFYLLSASAPYYSGSQYRIEVVSNVADNSIGGATQIIFRVTYTDSYAYTGSGSSSFPDNIDGTLTLTVDELRASGTLQPLGTGPFVITRPSYSISSISGS